MSTIFLVDRAEDDLTGCESLNTIVTSIVGAAVVDRILRGGRRPSRKNLGLLVAKKRLRALNSF